MVQRPLVTLLTDFGLRDPFVGIMKGVILRLCPEANLVDLCHHAEAYDVLSGSFLLHSVVRFFSPGTIHVAVVDPGVGGPRRAILARIDDQYFVAPDNGLLSYPMSTGVLQGTWALTAQEYLLQPISATFHGRDVFAPVAGHLARGVPAERFGDRVTDAVRLAIPRAEVVAPGRLAGRVMWIDRFGNCITNITQEDLARFAAEANRTLRVVLEGRVLGGLSRYFGEVAPGECGAVIGSAGHLELFCSRGNLAREWRIVSGTSVCLEMAG